MIVEVNGQTWADTPGVQAAVSKFHGRHMSFGDFTVTVSGEKICFFRMDDTLEGDMIARKYNFTGRPHRISGSAQAIATMIEELQDD